MTTWTRWSNAAVRELHGAPHTAGPGRWFAALRVAAPALFVAPLWFVWGHGHSLVHAVLVLPCAIVGVLAIVAAVWICTQRRLGAPIPRWIRDRSQLLEGEPYALVDWWGTDDGVGCCEATVEKVDGDEIEVCVSKAAPDLGRRGLNHAVGDRKTIGWRPRCRGNSCGRSSAVRQG